MPKNNSKAARERRRAGAQERQAIRDQRTLVEHEQIMWDRGMVALRAGRPNLAWRERRRILGRNIQED